MCTRVLHTKVGFEWFLYVYAYIHQWKCVGLVYYSGFVADALWQSIDFFKSNFVFFFSSYILYILSKRKAKKQICLPYHFRCLCNIIGIIFLAKVSRLLLFTPACGLILLGLTQMLQARGL